MSRRQTFRIARLGTVALLAVVSAGAASAGPWSGAREAPALARVATGLPGAVFAAPAPSGFPGRLYVIQRAGLVRIVDRGRLLEPPFLDIRERVAHGGLRGLYSLAFDPHYAGNGRFYVNYVGRGGDVYVSRFTAAHGVGAPSSERVLVHVSAPQKAPYGHYGGEVAFGPDGLLYASFGDDGRPETAQDPATLLGKLVRLDVGTTLPEPETVAVGLRNPWRFSFDRLTGDLYIGDVGEGRREEVDRLPRDFRGVANFGWPYREGSLSVRAVPDGLAGRLVGPFAEYRHARGRCNAVTGGYVYRGESLRSLRGRYLYGDLCGGVWSAATSGGTRQAPRPEPLAPPGLLVSFAEGSTGELYLVTLEGRVYQVVASGSPR